MQGSHWGWSPPAWALYNGGYPEAISYSIIGYHHACMHIWSMYIGPVHTPMRMQASMHACCLHAKVLCYCARLGVWGWQVAGMWEDGVSQSLSSINQNDAPIHTKIQPPFIVCNAIKPAARLQSFPLGYNNTVIILLHLISCALAGKN